MALRSLWICGLLAVAATASAQGPNPTNLWLVDLRWTGERVAVGSPVKLTADNGTNSQPSFTPDGRAIVFSATRDTGSSEIYRIELATRAETRVTRTPENENSPMVNARGEYVAVRWVPSTLFREFGPWVYAADGTPTRGVLRAPDTTGYFTPLPNGDYVLTRPKSRTFTIGLFDGRTGAIVDVDSGVPALPAQIVPGERAVTYVRVDSLDARHAIYRFDLGTRRAARLGPTLVGRTSHAWVPGRGTVLMAKGNVLYARTRQDTVWHAIATFTDPDLRNAAAYVVSPQGDKLILTSPKRLGLATVLRDSLEAGQPGSAIGNVVMELHGAGRLNDVDVIEGPISALGDDRIQKKRFADGLAMHRLATGLFPSSYRAFGRLGDALRTIGDTANAVAAFRKALELNPRRTGADSAAALAIERKLGGRQSFAPDGSRH